MAEALAIKSGQGSPLLHQVEGRLVLASGLKIGQSQPTGCLIPGGRQELVGTGGGTAITACDHEIGMAGHVAELASAVEHPIAITPSIGPGSFGKPDRVQQGPPFGCDPVETWPGRSKGQLLCLDAARRGQADGGESGVGRRYAAEAGRLEAPHPLGAWKLADHQRQGHQQRYGAEWTLQRRFGTAKGGGRQAGQQGQTTTGLDATLTAGLQCRPPPSR